MSSTSDRDALHRETWNKVITPAKQKPPATPAAKKPKSGIPEAIRIEARWLGQVNKALRAEGFDMAGAVNVIVASLRNGDFSLDWFSDEADR